MKHELKILPEYFEAVVRGIKTFEVRKDDRPYKPGDVLVLREYDAQKYTGRTCGADVLYVLRGEYCRDGYCIMSIKPDVLEAEWIEHMGAYRLYKKDTPHKTAAYTDYLKEVNDQGYAVILEGGEIL